MDAQSRQGWLTTAVVIGTAITVAGLASMLLRGRPFDVLWARWVVHNSPIAVASLWAGRHILRQQPRNVAGSMVLAAGGCLAIHMALVSLADARLALLGIVAAHPPVVPADLPLDASLPLWLSSWIWILGAVLAFQLLLTLDGCLPSRRWRWVTYAGAAGAALFAGAYAIETWPATSSMIVVYGNAPMQNAVAKLLAPVGSAAIVLSAAGCVTSLAARWRTAGSTERRQIRAVGSAGVLMVVVMVGLWPWQRIWVPASLLATWGFVGTYLVAITRSRLHDLDVVISRAVVGAVLAALVTAAYLVIVVGAGAVVGRGSDGRWLPLIAVGTVGVLFDPARRRVQALVDRLLYGREGDASQVLSTLAARLREAASAQDVLDRATGLLVRSTGAEGASVVVHVEGLERIAAESGDVVAPRLLEAPVMYRGEWHGEVRLHGRVTNDLTSDAPTLLDDIAGTVGVVLANLRLTAELEAQVDELRRSRERLVDAQSEARRSVERDLHDGAQARLVALRLRLGLADSLIDGGDVAEARGVVASLGDEVDEVIRSLRHLSRGLTPPVLESAGLEAALRAEVRRLPVPVRISSTASAGVRRYDAVVEAAVFFSCLEAVQNAVKHAGCDLVEVELSEEGGRLRFAVRDDGRGFDATSAHAGTGLRNLADRVAALDGRVHIESSVGSGCSVVGDLPVAPIDTPPVATPANEPQPLVADR